MTRTLPDPAAMASATSNLISICHDAWREGFMAGWSGNASIRLAEDPRKLLITASGSAKGHLTPEDCLLLNLEGLPLTGTARPSSESRLHTLLYENFSEVGAILHTHPPYLQALELALDRGKEEPGESLQDQYLTIGLFEANLWRKRLYFGAALPPGTDELAQSAVNGILEALENDAKRTPLPLPLAVWLPRHGLCAMGKKLADCLCLTEELEHLAQVQLLSAGS